MRRKLLPKVRKPAPDAVRSAGLLYARAQILIAKGRYAVARRVLLALARMNGPYQARARALLARLSNVTAGVRPKIPVPAQYRMKARMKFTKKLSKPSRPTMRTFGYMKPSPKRLLIRRKKRGGGSGFGWGAVDFGVAPGGRGIGDVVMTGSPPASAPRRSPKRSTPRRPRTRPVAAKKPGVIRRTPHIGLPPGSVSPSESFTVTVYVDKTKAKPGEDSKDVVIQKKEKQDIYSVDVWLAGSSHFIVKDRKAQILKVDARNAKSAPVSFKVRVADRIDDPSGAVLFAYFTYEGRPSGQVSRTVNVKPSKPMAASGGEPQRKKIVTSFRIAPGVASADLTVEVTDPQRNGQSLVCRVSSRLLGQADQPQAEDWFLPAKSGTLVKNYMEEFVKDTNHRAYSLIGAGKLLYKAAPESFKQLLWKLIDDGTAPASILITSDEPYIPWELMVPWRKKPDGTSETRQALGVEFKVGRWPRDDHQSPPVTVPLKDSYVIAPVYDGEPAPLLNAADEVALVIAAVPGVKIDPADLKNIKKQLATGGRSLLHFVCHGADGDGSDVQAIFLDGGDERLTSLEVTAIPPIEQAFKARPMVFLNACEVGRPTVALSGIGGFAAAFLELGAGAVIAPLWSVKDDIAFKVAGKFYKAVTASKPGGKRKEFADIMRGIRALAYDEETGEDTYAAYCFYGDPNASAN
jgi:hypothetical protein